MIQRVDIICGSVGAFIDEGDATWYALIADRDVERRPLI
jgi:hypothetical protein